MTLSPPTSPPVEPRRFSPGQRHALWLASDGRCESCGCDLPPGWHADHWQPYSTGGATDVINGQALCPTCNLQKGATVPTSLESWNVPLRDWQADAFSSYVERRQQNFVLVATPGAGKTLISLRIMSHFIREREELKRPPKIIVVVPTHHLRGQWADKAHETSGIQLQRDWTNGNPFVASDFHGMVVTYQSVSKNEDAFRRFCHDFTVLVVLDECHHAGDHLIWGDAIRYAFEPAERRLLLSGTLFRRDNNPIPFVDYQNNLSVADYIYGYGRAIRDRVCRQVLFPHRDGRMEWRDDKGFRTATFDDDLDEDGTSRRLRTALSALGDWLRHMIFEAHQTLLDAQAIAPDAAGMVVAMDQYHAKRIAELVEEITGTVPVLAISEDPDASKLITAFTEYETSKDRPWLVCVKMVSEGVDIPRLAVGVYASNIVSELFFRQVVGRFVRRIGDSDEQVATLFVPKDLRLIEFCEAIEQERDHALDELERDAQDMFEEYESGNTTNNPRPFEVIGAAPGALGYVFGGKQFAEALAVEGRRLCAALGRSRPEDLAFTMQLLELSGWGPQSVTMPESPTANQGAQRPPSTDAMRAKLKDLGTQRAHRLGGVLRELLDGSGLRKDRLYQLLHAKVARRIGCNVGAMNVDQLQERVILLDQWITYAVGVKAEGRSAGWVETWLQD